MKLFSFMRSYPSLVATAMVGLIGLGLSAGGAEWLTRWILSSFCGLIALRSAWEMVQAIRRGHYGIDILAVMAIVSTVAIGEYWAATVIVLMLAGGQALEDFAAGRARQELQTLLERAPQVAHQLQSNGSVGDVPIGSVPTGDLLVVKPGEVIPVDATLEQGSAVLDESSLTGESLPVERVVGDELLSGAVNGENSIVIRALRSAESSQYQQIIRLVEAAASSQAPFVRLADRYAVPFTAMALSLAGLAWALSGDPLRFAQVLVVATPCPLLIAAPVAMISGMSRAARHGIIIKNGATLEKLASIQTVAFDKTGTLTYGQPKVDRIISTSALGEDDILRIAAGAEQYSNHILAHALVAASQERQLALAPAEQIQEKTAQGVMAMVEGRHVLAGKAQLLRDAGIDFTEPTTSVGQTAIHLAIDGIVAGSITFTDQIRHNSQATLAQLKTLGVAHTLLLTGDARPIAQRIAAALGIQEIKAECLPQDKVTAVAALPNRPVLMVGDGVNDAPALAAADVGMAMGARGSTAASETADVVVMLDDISKSAKAIAIAKNTLRIARQSIWIGIAISIALMLFATTGHIPPILGAGLQELVDILVIFNALRAHRV